ncbi:MAG: lamin tail domain-containing protein [Bacteroidota bacterium]
MEDFSDGNFDQRPVWISSQFSGKDDFVIFNGRLRSDGPDATSGIYISTAGNPTFIESMLTWQFDVEYNQAPSGSNNIRVYIGADTPDLLGTVSGYYIQLGESGTDDGVDFYRTTSNDPLIVDAAPSISGAVNLTIRLTRTETGEWSLYRSEPGSDKFDLVGTVVDTEIIIGEHFGFLINHTSSRNDDYFFDNVLLPFPDNIPPTLESVAVINDRSIALQFSEELEATSAENIDNYTSPSFGNPAMANLDSNQVTLRFTNSFLNATNYQLSIANLRDQNNNILEPTEAQFFYFQQPPLELRDIIISEFLADPDPPNDLPDGEFVEIYNRSDKIFNLSQWSISDLSNSVTLMDTFLFPSEYLIICAQEYYQDYSVFGRTMGIERLPTLNNGGDAIVIRDESGNISDSIRYDLSWYRSSDKQEGGWSLEIIDPTNDCAQKSNWTASEDFTGGTPAVQNSVFAEKPDLTGPKILSVFAFSPDTLDIKFNEILDPNSIALAAYSITPNTEVASVIISENLLSLKLILKNSLESGITYTLSISNIRDCPGNVILAEAAVFTLIQAAEPGDILLNEVLFNPLPGGADFLELFNVSEKYINLKDWFLGNFELDADNVHPINLKKIVSDNLIIAPHDYLVFTEQDNLSDFYSSIDINKIVIVESLPSMPNDMGTISLTLSDTSLMDAFGYRDDFHFSLLTDKKGVSLERISTNQLTNSSTNWRSAASTVGFGTPGLRNSQSLNETATSNTIWIEPSVIIPDGTGQNDFASIIYQFDQPGNVANVRIYDAQGRQVKVLADNETLDSRGFFIWDGLNEQGAKARTGYYLVYFELFDSTGNVSTFKEKVVVGTRF